MNVTCLGGGQNILWPLLHIFRGSRPPPPQHLRRWFCALFWSTQQHAVTVHSRETNYG